LEKQVINSIAVAHGPDYIQDENSFPEVLSKIISGF